MEAPIVVSARQLDAFINAGHPLLCLVIKNDPRGGLRLAVIDLTLNQGGVIEITLSHSPKLRIGDPVLFKKIAGEVHVVRTEPTDEAARHKLLAAREGFLPDLYGN